MAMELKEEYIIAFYTRLSHKIPNVWNIVEGGDFSIDSKVLGFNLENVLDSVSFNIEENIPVVKGKSKREIILDLLVSEGYLIKHDGSEIYSATDKGLAMYHKSFQIEDAKKYIGAIDAMKFYEAVNRIFPNMINPSINTTYLGFPDEAISKIVVETFDIGQLVVSTSYDSHLTVNEIGMAALQELIDADYLTIGSKGYSVTHRGLAEYHAMKLEAKN